MDEETRGFCVKLLGEGVLDIRDVDAGVEPFLYTSGKKGPGFCSVKDLVGKPGLLTRLTQALIRKMNAAGVGYDFAAGNVTGGMNPAWIIANEMSVPGYVYVRDAKKAGGRQERIVGLGKNPHYKPGDCALVVEELVNGATTTCSSAIALREAGFKVTHACCILSYDHSAQHALLKEHAVELISLVTLDELLTVAEDGKMFGPHLFASYREYLQNPEDWMAKRDITPNKG